MTRITTLTLLLCTLIASGCARFLTGPPGGEAAKPLQLFEAAERHQRAGNFARALETYRAIVQRHAGSELVAAARYNIALIHVLASNPEKDYAQALAEFEEFLVRFPQHDRVEEAKSWRMVIKMTLDAKKENERLSKSIEQLQQLDVKQEEKRLGR
jgi:outer membrane protein assembly factor BamD (BamD/ComL family)